jgi:hypothetical protein
VNIAGAVGAAKTYTVTAAELFDSGKFRRTIEL